MMSAQTQQYYTPEQYLEMERKTPYKSEYYKGEIFAMAAAKIRHNALKDIDDESFSRKKL